MPEECKLKESLMGGREMPHKTRSRESHVAAFNDDVRLARLLLYHCQLVDTRAEKYTHMVRDNCMIYVLIYSHALVCRNISYAVRY